MSYECKICGHTDGAPVNFTRHLKKIHHLNNEEYYKQYLNTDENVGICKVCGKPTRFYGFIKGFSEFCSVSCSNVWLAKHAEEVELECKICHETVKSTAGTANASQKLAGHIKKAHNMDIKPYYDTYIRKENEGKCPICGKDTEFKSLMNGYFEYCSQNCAQNGHKEDKNSFISKVMAVRNVRELVTKITKGITEKYQNFIKTDPHKHMDDIRSDSIEQKLIKEEKIVETIDGDKVPVKTEIAVQSYRNNWIGTQEYIPRKEHCQREYKSRFVDDFNDDQQFSSNEWC